MTPSTTINQLSNSLLEFLPNLTASDIIIPQLNHGTLNAEEGTRFIPLILLASKDSIKGGLSDLEAGIEEFILQYINLKGLSINTKNLFKPRKSNQEDSKTVTVIRPNEITAISQDQVFLKKVLNSIEENMNNERFGVEKLAEHAGMSVNNLNRKLGRLINKTAGKLIRSMRLQRAADLIKQNAGSMSEIAYDTGFSSPANFTRCFKKEFGISPSKYQQSFN